MLYLFGKGFANGVNWVLFVFYHLQQGGERRLRAGGHDGETGHPPVFRVEDGPAQPGGRRVLFQFPDACREGSANAGTQCMNIVRRLKSKIPALLDIREKWNVDFFLCVQANVEAEPLPELVFDRDVLAFCYLTGTKVKVELCHPAPEIPEIQDAAAEGEE